MTKVRILPVLLFGLVSLLSIKLMTIAMNLPAQRGYDPTVDPFARAIAVARQGGADDQIVTGSAGKKKEEPPAQKPDEKAGEKPMSKPEADKARAEMFAKGEQEGVIVPPPPNNPGSTPTTVSAQERALLEKLKDRRGEIDARDRDLEMRDNLLRMSERKLDERIGELRTLENQAGQNGAKNDPKSRYRPLVVMYESMKPKEAARVFDRLDTRILIDLVAHMNPRKMSEILAVMEPAAAEKLTVALARQAAQGEPQVAETTPATAEPELPRLPPPAPKR